MALNSMPVKFYSRYSLAQKNTGFSCTSPTAPIHGHFSSSSAIYSFSSAGMARRRKHRPFSVSVVCIQGMPRSTLSHVEELGGREGCAGRKEEERE